MYADTHLYISQRGSSVGAKDIEIPVNAFHRARWIWEVYRQHWVLVAYAVGTLECLQQVPTSCNQRIESVCVL